MSLLNKKVQTELYELKNDTIEVQRRDPNSPLYSVRTFEEMHLKPEILKGQTRFFSKLLCIVSFVYFCINNRRWTQNFCTLLQESLPWGLIIRPRFRRRRSLPCWPIHRSTWSPNLNQELARLQPSPSLCSAESTTTFSIHRQFWTHSLRLSCTTNVTH